jgi:hypothetical protein
MCSQTIFPCLFPRFFPTDLDYNINHTDPSYLEQNSGRWKMPSKVGNIALIKFQPTEKPMLTSNILALMWIYTLRLIQCIHNHSRHAKTKSVLKFQVSVRSRCWENCDENLLERHSHRHARVRVKQYYPTHPLFWRRDIIMGTGICDVLQFKSISFSS